jgi:ABC-type transporter MlaC component
MSSRRTLLKLASMALAAAAVPPALAASAMVKPAEDLVNKAANEFLAAIRNGSERKDFASLFERYVSIEAIAMFALGKHRRRLPPDQREKYVGLVNDMLLNTVTRHGKHINGRAFVVTGSRGSIVSGYIQHDGGHRTGVDMRLADGRIADIRVEGIWLAFILRQEFNRIIDNGKGDISVILTHLEREPSL